MATPSSFWFNLDAEEIEQALMNLVRDQLPSGIWQIGEWDIDPDGRWVIEARPFEPDPFGPQGDSPQDD